MALVALSLASAVTESIGLILLVPILAMMSNTTDLPGPLGQLAQRIGGPENLGVLLLLFVALVLLRGLLNYNRALVALSVQRQLIDGLRQRAWRAILHCDWRVLARMKLSDNASLLITTIDRVGLGIDRTVNGTVTLITLFGVGAASLAISPAMTFGAAVAGVFIIVAHRNLRKRARTSGAALDNVYDRIHAVLSEGLGALRIIKSFGVERAAERRLTVELQDLHDTERQFVRDNGRGQLVMQFGSAVFLALAVWLALRYWHVDVGIMLPMVALFARALPLLIAFQGCLQELAHTRPAIDTAIALIERAEAAREPELPAGTTIPVVTRYIGLRGITLQYPGRSSPAIEAVDLDLPIHSITALSGPSGAGKSTLADVIGGLLIPDTGELLIDGHTLDFDMRRAWRMQVAYVQQTPILFAGTVRENLLLGLSQRKDLVQTAEEELLAALADANADFVSRLPNGLDTHLGENGHALSGGERQRLILARAMLRSPQLLILDEAANSLDRENDEAIAQVILRLRQRCTILVIAHGGALECIADRKICISRGRVDTMLAGT